MDRSPSAWFDMIVSIDDSLPVPAYDQLRQQLADAIIGGVLVPGERLAPIRQLARDLGIAPGTVARAYRELEADRLIVADGRNGTFVASGALGQVRRSDEIAAIIDSCAARLERFGLTGAEAARLLGERMRTGRPAGAN